MIQGLKPTRTKLSKTNGSLKDDNVRTELSKERERERERWRDREIEEAKSET